LVAYFEGDEEPSDEIFAIYLAERNAKRPNLPLIRKYFKKANPKLKALLIYGVDHYPGRIDLLSDLTYFHEFENILTTLITCYTRACVNQVNLETFTVLAQDFYYATSPDGYEAYHALQELFEPHTEKRKIIDFLISEEEDTGKLVSLVGSSLCLEPNVERFKSGDLNQLEGSPIKRYLEVE
jgi:hypothetical protein